MYAIDIRNLTKDYGSGKGVFDITLAVEPGEIYGYLGPNGAGKSTTMRHLMGFSRPQSGTAFVEGRGTAGGSRRKYSGGWATFRVRSPFPRI